MVNYQEVRDKLTNSRLNKLKSAAESKTETVLWSNKKKVEDEELPHELFLRTTRTIKIRNGFTNNMSTSKKLKYLK